MKYKASFEATVTSELGKRLWSSGSGPLAFGNSDGWRVLVAGVRHGPKEPCGARMAHRGGGGCIPGL